MKIAIVGKGGSGKSTVSWLLSMFLSEDLNQKTLAIDADHNMDLIANIGYEFNDVSPTISKSSLDARAYLNIQDGKHIKTILQKNFFEVPKFSFPNKDKYTENNTINYSKNLSIMNAGLGDNAVLYSGKCAHGHIAPLKFYIPLLQLDNDCNVIIDSVAGIDMVNFGLFFGCDLVLIVAENHFNSIKVEK